jgi:hypothetical protein
MQTVAALTSQLFDRIFGHKYFSKRSIVISVCLSMTSFTSVTCWRLIENGYLERPNPNAYPIFVGWIAFLIATIILVRKPAIADTRTCLIVVLSVALFIVDRCMSLWAYTPITIPKQTGFFLESVAFLVVSFGTDLLCIVAIRWMTRWAERLTQFVSICAAILLTLAIAAGLCLLPLAWALERFRAYSATDIDIYQMGYMMSNNSELIPRMHFYEFVVLLSASNMVDAVFASIFFLLILAMLIHRLFWPLLQRGIYALADLGVLGHRKLLGTAGLALLGFGFGKPLELLSKLVDVFTKKGG